MSEQVTMKGKLTPTDYTARGFIEEYTDECVSVDWDDFIQDNGHIRIDDVIYKLDDEDLTDPDFMVMDKNEDGSISFYHVIL